MDRNTNGSVVSTAPEGLITLKGRLLRFVQSSDWNENMRLKVGPVSQIAKVKFIQEKVTGLHTSTQLVPRIVVEPRKNTSYLDELPLIGKTLIYLSHFEGPTFDGSYSYWVLAGNSTDINLWYLLVDCDVAFRNTSG